MSDSCDPSMDVGPAEQGPLLARRCQALVAQANFNLAKIRSYQTHLTSIISTASRTFLDSNLSRFSDSHDAMEMITYIKKKLPEIIQVEEEWEEVGRSKHTNLPPNLQRLSPACNVSS